MNEAEKTLQELLDETHFRYGGTLFLAADGSFVNTKGEFISAYEVLIKLEKLRDAVSRGRDLLSVYMAKRGLKE